MRLSILTSILGLLIGIAGCLALVNHVPAANEAIRFLPTSFAYLFALACVITPFWGGRVVILFVFEKGKS